jgi:hypothetical protein
VNLLRRVVGVGASAALLGSLVATIAAPGALASTSVVSAGSIPVGRTSAGTATFYFMENSRTAFPSSGGTLTVTVLDFAGANTLTLGGGTLSAPGSLVSSLSVSSNTFTVTTTNADPFNIETITVSGITISASGDAAIGAVQATLSGTLADAVTVGGPYTLASPGTVTSKASASVEGVASEFRVAQVITGLPPNWTGALVTLWTVYVSEGVTRDGTGPPLHDRRLSVRQYEMWCEGTAPRICYSHDLLTASGTDWEFEMDAAARAAHLVGTVEVHEGSLVRNATIEASWTSTDTDHDAGGAQKTDDPPGTSFHKTAYWDNNAIVAMTFDGAAVDGQRGYLAVWKTMAVSVVP